MSRGEQSSLKTKLKQKKKTITNSVLGTRFESERDNNFSSYLRNPRCV